MDTPWIFCPILLVLLYIVGATLCHLTVVQRLKTRHEDLWLELGAPTWIDGIVGVRYPGDVLKGAGATFIEWLKAERYLELDDGVLRTAGAIVAALNLVVLRIGVVSTAALFLWSVWHRRFGS